MVSYRKGRKTRKLINGGFFPSIMGGVLKAGSYLLPLVMRQGSKLLERHNRLSEKSKKKTKKNSTRKLRKNRNNNLKSNNTIVLEDGSSSTKSERKWKSL